MRKILYVLLICIVYQVASESDSDKNELSRDRRQILRNIVNSIFTNFETYICNARVFVTLALCCNSPIVGSLANRTEARSIIQSCYSSFATTDISAFIDLFTNYVFAAWTTATNGIVDLTNPTTISLYGARICAADCYFQNKSMMAADGTIDYTVAAEVLSSYVSTNWQTSVSDAVTNCKTSVELETTTTITYKSNTCYTYPTLLIQCVRKALYNTCPTASRRTTTGCKTAYKNLQQCGQYTLPLRSQKKAKSVKILKV